MFKKKDYRPSGYTNNPMYLSKEKELDLFNSKEKMDFKSKRKKKFKNRSRPKSFKFKKYRKN